MELNHMVSRYTNLSLETRGVHSQGVLISVKGRAIYSSRVFIIIGFIFRRFVRQAGQSPKTRVVFNCTAECLQTLGNNNVAHDDSEGAVMLKT